MQHYKKKIPYLLTGILSLWFVAGLFSDKQLFKETHNSKDISFIRTEVFTPKPYLKSIKLHGIIDATHIKKLSAQVSGKINTIAVIDGQEVKKGDLILEIEDHDKKENLLMAETNLEKAKIQYNAAKSVIDSGGGSKTYLKDSLHNLQNAERNLESSKLNLEYTKIIAPCNGVVNKVHVKSEELASQGQILVEFIEEHDSIYIKSFVTKNIAKEIKIGNLVHIFDEDSSHQDGFISYISKNDINKSHKYEILVKTQLDKNYMLSEIVKIKIFTKECDAILIDQSTVCIDEKGNLGIKIFEDGIVKFIHAEILDIDENSGQYWISLKEHKSDYNVIVIGQNSVSEGENY